MRQDELAEPPVEGEAVNAPSHGEDQHGSRPIDRVSGAQLLHSGLQEVGFAGHRRSVRRLQYGKNTAHRRIDIDVAGTVQRIEGQQILAAREFFRNFVRLLEFFRDHAGQISAIFTGAQKDVVRQDVQLHLRLALNVRRLRRPLCPRQSAAADDEADALARQAHMIQQGRKISRTPREFTLLLHHEFCNRLFSRAHESPKSLIALFAFANGIELSIYLANAEHAAADQRGGARRQRIICRSQ